MPIDRTDTIRRAEKLLRQGRVDAAIAEYASIVEAYPNDLATANLIGDLHLRAGHVDRAVAEYTRLAEHFVRSGFVPRASALYKKIIKIRPDDDHALLRLSELAAAQGLAGEARAGLLALYRARLTKGDRAGAADVAVRRIAADSSDVAARFDAARLLGELGDTARAAGHLREAGSALLHQGRAAEGLRALGEALRLNPDDGPTRDLLVDACIQAGDFDEAGEVARTASQFGGVAHALLAAGQADAAEACLSRALAEHPGDAGVRMELARMELARGRPEAALAALPSRTDDETRDVTLLRVEILGRAGRGAEAREIVEALVRSDSDAADAAAQVCLSLTGVDAGVALTCLEPVVDAARRSGDVVMAKRVVQRLIDLSGDPIEALRMLIDVCDDLADEDGVYHGQVRLTDELLAVGRFGEARILAELLIEKRPDVERHAERLRAATEGLGPDVGAGVKAVFADGEDSGALDADLRHALETAEVASVSDDAPASFEVDLSVALNELLAGGSVARRPAREPERPASTADGSEAAGPESCAADLSDSLERSAGAVDLAGFFQSLREESGAADLATSAARAFDMASQAYNEGRPDESHRHLLCAARDPALRFRATALLARIDRDAGRLPEAIEWLERAAESPAPSAGAWDALLYELGCALHDAGEGRRALAVFMELHAASPDYRDVEEWMGRLGHTGGAHGRTAPERDPG